MLKHPGARTEKARKEVSIKPKIKQAGRPRKHKRGPVAKSQIKEQGAALHHYEIRELSRKLMNT